MLSSKKFKEQKELLASTQEKLLSTQRQLQKLKAELATTRKEKEWLQQTLSDEMDSYVVIKDEHRHLTKLTHWKNAMHERMVSKYDAQMLENKRLQDVNHRLTKMVLVTVSTALLQRHWRQKTVKNLHDRLTSMKALHSESLTEFQNQFRMTTPTSPLHRQSGSLPGSRPGSRGARKGHKPLFPQQQIDQVSSSSSPTPSASITTSPHAVSASPDVSASDSTQTAKAEEEECLPSSFLSDFGFSGGASVERDNSADQEEEKEKEEEEEEEEEEPAAERVEFSRPKSVKFDLSASSPSQLAALQVVADVQVIRSGQNDTLDEIEEFLNVVHQQRQQWEDRAKALMDERQSYVDIINNNKQEYRLLENDFQCYIQETKRIRKENVKLREKADLLDWGSVENNRQYKTELRQHYQTLQQKLKQEDANMRLKWQEVERMVERLNELEENYVHVDAICRQFLRRLPLNARKQCKQQLDELRLFAMRHTTLHTKHEYMRLFGFKSDPLQPQAQAEEGEEGDDDDELRRGLRSLQTAFDDIYIPDDNASSSSSIRNNNQHKTAIQVPLTSISSPLFPIDFDAPLRPPVIELASETEASKVKLAKMKRKLAGKDGWTK